MIHPLASEAAVAARGAFGMLHARHQVVLQRGILLHGGHTRNLFLATVVVAAQSKGVLTLGVGDSGRELIVEQL